MLGPSVTPLLCVLPPPLLAPIPPTSQGLPGADQVPGYMFVDERPGGWVSEARRLNTELAARGKTQVRVRRLGAVFPACWDQGCMTLPPPLPLPRPPPRPSPPLAQVPVEARRMSGEGAGQARKRPPRPSRKEAEENAVRRVRAAAGLGVHFTGGASSWGQWCS
jgi:hypothetical protein